MTVSVVDTNTMDFLDDPATNSPPWIVFEFKFKENPLVTARIEQENEDLKDGPITESRNAFFIPKVNFTVSNHHSG